jgi:hypothetical protein
MVTKIIILTDEAFETLNEKLDMLISSRKDQQLAPDRKWMNSGEVMQMLNISKSTLQIYRDKGIIPFSQIGRKIMYYSDDIQHALENMKTTNYLPIKQRTK